MAAAQRDRIGNFLELDRAWTFETWKTRYLDHPLLAGISRRLIWQFEQGKRTASGIWHQKGFVAADGKDLETPNAAAKVRLWHPLGVDPDRVQAWRRWLMEHEVTQPFKQAFREIYILTDAERKTHNYSNRFAGHILRQHQFKALCQQRGWSYEFIGEWDQSDPVATKDLSSLKLRAEFWIEPTQSGAADSGVSLLVAIDRVRFRTPDRQVVPLTDVPALVFSEIMRDVDLFVSVGTVGNDPQWADTGDERGRDYWRKWAFGELTVTAAMRREILERLLPKLRIASRCSLAGRFLNVRGSLTTYKIHLGSGHVLMEPNDKYLCIGPDWSRARSKAGDKVFLPFEGDSIFSIILSEAFLLAEDSRIKDETILNQIAAD
jgi:hypothetical protein